MILLDTKFVIIISNKMKNNNIIYLSYMLTLKYKPMKLIPKQVSRHLPNIQVVLNRNTCYRIISK